MTHKDHNNTVLAFNAKARWNLFGSVFYETLRIGHNTVLALLFTPEIFGLVGSLFASTFLVVRLSDVGATNALLPFFGFLEQSRKSFNAFFLKKLFLPIFITAPIGAGAASIFLHSTHHQALASCAVILPLLMLSETLRAFLRQFLHLAGQSKYTVLFDQGTFVGYILISWPALYFYPGLRTPVFVFSLFLVDSLIAVASFFILTRRVANRLPEDAPLVIEEPTPKAFYLARLYAWLMRACKELFSSNALTPLFAATVGLKQAGLFYFAATLAMALQAIMRSVIGYAGASFFISARKAGMGAAQAFSHISQKLSSLLLVLTIFFVASYHDIIKLTHATAATSQLTIFFVLYFAIVVVEFTLFLYEQQYQFEQAGAKALQWRLLELLLVYITSRGFISFSPVSTLACILVAKVGTMVALALSGYKHWGIRPSLHMPVRQAVLLGGVGLCLSQLFKIVIYVFHLI